MKFVLLFILSISAWANFFVVDKGRVIEIVNEPNKNIQIVGSNGKVLKKYKKISHIKKSKYSKYSYKKSKKKKYLKRKWKKRVVAKHKRYKKIHKKAKSRVIKRVVKKRKKIKDLIVIRTAKRILEFYKNGKWYKNYKIAVGKDGWRVYGKFWIRKKVKWPDWRPTKRILEENPNLPQIVPGGSKNPLGARALYLGYSAIRIHGTNNPKSIGKAVSHGCFRMKNKDVIELYNLVKIGTPVYIK